MFEETKSWSISKYKPSFIPKSKSPNLPERFTSISKSSFIFSKFTVINKSLNLPRIVPLHGERICDGNTPLIARDHLDKPHLCSPEHRAQESGDSPLSVLSCKPLGGQAVIPPPRDDRAEKGADMNLEERGVCSKT